MFLTAFRARKGCVPLRGAAHGQLRSSLPANFSVVLLSTVPFEPNSHLSDPEDQSPIGRWTAELDSLASSHLLRNTRRKCLPLHGPEFRCPPRARSRS